MIKKPIRIFYSTLSDRFYASSQYREKNGVVVITGSKTDVTNEIAQLIEQHEITFTAAPTAAQESGAA